MTPLVAPHVVRIAVVTGLMVAVACGPGPQDTVPAGSSSAGTGSPSSEEGGLVGINLENEVGRRFPGFAGFWIDEGAGVTTVFLKGDADQQVAEAVVDLLAEANDDPTFLQRRVVARGGAQYSYQELADWFARVGPEVLAMEGVYLGGVDQMGNRISFGVANPQEVEVQIADLLRRHEVPHEAVVIEESGPAVQAPRGGGAG